MKTSTCWNDLALWFDQMTCTTAAFLAIVVMALVFMIAYAIKSDKKLGTDIRPW